MNENQATPLNAVGNSVGSVRAAAEPTEGPWHFFARPKPRRSNFDKTKFGAVYVGSVSAGDGINTTHICEIQGGSEVVANMRFIAESRTHLPALIAAVDKALAAWDADDINCETGVRRFQADFSALRALREQMK